MRIAPGEIENLLAPIAGFDPATTKLCFCIGTPDCLAPPLMASPVSYLRVTTPKARLVLQPHRNGYDYEGALAKPPIDFSPMRFDQLWHSRAQQSQSHAWLRSLLSAVARTADAVHGLCQPEVISLTSGTLLKLALLTLTLHGLEVFLVFEKTTIQC